MTEDTNGSYRATISSVDARVGRLEESHADLSRRQGELEGVMRLVQLEQQHLREIMTSRFAALEGMMQAQSSKLDGFIGKVELLIAEGQRSSQELTASPLGRQVDHRLTAVEEAARQWSDFQSRLVGMTTLVRGLLGTSVAGLILGLFGFANAMGWI